MQTTSSAYHGFAMEQEALNKKLVEIITTAADVEAVWLLGLRMEHHRTETLFSVPCVTRRGPGHYWLLVAAKENPGQVRLQDSLESRLYTLMPSTVIALSSHQYRDWLTAGHPFAVAVQQRGYVLYTHPEATQVEPTPVDTEAVATDNACLFTRTKSNVKGFLAGAELYTIRVQYRLAAFLLHQAAEQALRAMMILYTGLRVNTHSLERLVRYCSLFCYSLQDRFVGNSDGDKRLFKLLQAAYIDSRYATDYSINGENIERLTGRVKVLYTLFLEWGTGTAVPLPQNQPVSDEQ